MKARGVVLILVLALAAMLGWLLHTRFYWAREETWVGYQGEALDNDFLAAQRLLQRTGHAAACLHGLPAQLPPPGDVLILPRRSALAKAEAARIADWVAGGGLLLAAAAEPPDSLFARFGARLDPVPASGATRFSLDGKDLELELGGMVQRDLGQGGAVLCTDLDCLRNDRIQAHDHADFLCAVAARRPRGGVWIITRDAAGSAWGWLWQRAWPALVALAALCLGALWAAAPRFGPRLADPDPARRSFLEHLDACGRYQWREAQGRPLLAAARASFLQRLGQRHPAWADLPPGQLCLRLAQRSGLPQGRIERALHQPAAHAAGFLEAIQTLHLLGRHL
jgi:hypothetical protein